MSLVPWSMFRWRALAALLVVATVVLIGILQLHGRQGPETVRRRPDDVASGAEPEASNPREGQGLPRSDIVLHVQVEVAGGKPLADAVVRSRLLRGGPWLTGNTDEHGGASLSFETGGPCLLEVSAPGFAPAQSYSEVPGSVTVTLATAATLQLELRPFPHRFWEGVTLVVRDQNGVERALLPTDSDVDAGSWAPGLVQIHARSGRGEELLASVAMPERGGLRAPVSVPVPRGLRLRVMAADTGGTLPDWSARAPGDPAAPPFERRPVQGDVYKIEVPGTIRTLLVDSPGYATAVVRIDSGRDDVHEVVLHRSASIRLVSEVQTDPTRAHVYLLGSQGAEPDFSPVLAAGEFAPAGAVLDVATATRQFDPDSLIAEVEFVGETRLLGVPPRANLAVRAVHQDAATTLVVTTGEPGEETVVALSWPSVPVLTVDVRRANGEPAGLCPVNVLQRRGPLWVRRGGVISDVAGRVRIRGLEPEEQYRLMIVDVLAVHVVDVGPADLRHSGSLEIRLRAPETRQAEIEVLDNAGPVTGAYVGLSIPDGPTYYTLTGEDGKARASVPSGVRVLVAARRGADPPVVRRLPENGRLTLRLKSATELVATLRLRDGSGIVNVEVWKGTSRIRRFSVFVDREGVLRVSRLRPGQYEVRATYGQDNRSAVAQVDAGGTTLVALEF